MRYYEIQNEMNKHNSCFASKTRQNRCHRASYPHFQPAPLCARALFRNLGDSSFCWKLLFLSLKGNFRVHRFVRAYDVKTGLSKDPCHTTRLKSRLTRLSTFIRDDEAELRGGRNGSLPLGLSVFLTEGARLPSRRKRKSREITIYRTYLFSCHELLLHVEYIGKE